MAFPAFRAASLADYLDSDHLAMSPRESFRVPEDALEPPGLSLGPVSWSSCPQTLQAGAKLQADSHASTWHEKDLRRNSDVGSVGTDATDLTDATAECASICSADLAHDLTEFLPRRAAPASDNIPRAQARASVKRKEEHAPRSDDSKVAKSGKKGRSARPAPLPVDTQQFLPIGMMMAALAMSKSGNKRPGARR